jgi:hypothetical protein
MKKFKSFVCLLFGFIFFSSCTPEEVTPIANNDWKWGYFRGAIDGKLYNLIDREVGSVGMIVDSVRLHQRTAVIDYSDTHRLSVTLSELHNGKRYLLPTVRDTTTDFRSAIALSVFNEPSKLTYKHRYRPSNKNPFFVEILSVTWRPDIIPIIEAKLDGVLYNTENPNDSIIIKGAYGIY